MCILMKAIDLTHDVKNGMMIYPGDPAVEIMEGLTHEKDYCHVDRLLLNSHTGTHIDAPYHFLPDGKRITDYDADKFICKGRCIDLRHKQPGEAITVEDVAGTDLQEGMCVILATGWYRYFGDEMYLNHPYIAKETAEYFAAKGISIVAVDFLNVDQTLVEAWDAHPALLGNDTLIVENLSNTEQLDSSCTYLFSFLPLKISGSDGSPIRAVAMEL